MLPRRFALIRHVDYTGGAGTGVIAYGVAFDDGQVVLRWSSAHRATSVLDSVEDLIAAHGHGETTSIEWIDAVPGTAEPAAQQGGRRARRAAPPNDASSTADLPQHHKQAATVAAESGDVRPAAQVPQSTAPTEPATAHSPAPLRQKPASAEADAPTAAQPAPSPAAGKPADVRPAARTSQPTTASGDSHSTAPVPAVSPAPAPPATPAQPTAPAPAQPAAAQPAAAAPAWGPGKSAFEPPASPGPSPDPAAPSSSPRTAAGQVPAPPKAPETLTPAAHASPTANGTRPTPRTTQPTDTPRSGPTPPSPDDPPPVWGGTSRTSRNDDRRSPDHDADVIDHPAAARPTDDERRARHAAIATQPMNADPAEERAQRRARRAAPMHESPRSIFDEVEERPRPDLRLASSNGRDADSPEGSGDGSPDREEFGGFFATGHQHLDTVTGLLDLPAGLNKRGRGADSDQDIGSRRNGRHRGE